MHRGDEDFADLANLGFAKICEYLGLKSFLKMKGNVACPPVSQIVRENRTHLAAPGKQRSPDLRYQ
jgi:hypothetical protein